MPQLRFIPNAAGEGEGLSDAGIETYRDAPFPAVARETSQNSRDAYDGERCPGEPVRVVIEKLSVPTQSLPAHGEYLATVRRCLEIARHSGTKKEVDFFTQAERVLTQPEIPVLRVADYNTFGLKGPCEEGKPFWALVKSSGISDKLDDTSGGSFGIGKSAVYSASDLQTVFYSTVWSDAPGADSFLCQGKTKFRSFRDDTGQAFRSIGYWGNPEGFLPVADPALVPDWLHRTEIGTTVCSIAVRETDDWQKETVASLIMNFFAAINAGKMEFVVDGDAINVGTLRRRFDDSTVRQGATEEQFSFARAMYDCLTDRDDAQEHRIDIPGAGSFRLRILVRDGLPKRIGVIRNGMYICDSMYHFDDRFRQFPMYRDFIAVVEPADDDASGWLRAMENPRHDELSPERLLEPEQRTAARAAGKKLAKAIREAVKNAAKSAKETDTDLEELSEFFAIDNEGREDKDGSRNLNSFRVQPSTWRKKPKKSRIPLDDEPGEHGGAATGGNPGGGNGGGGGGGGAGGTVNGAGTRARRKPLILSGLRTIVHAADPAVRQIFFTPASTGVAKLDFESSGLTETQPLELEGGDCTVECVEGRRQELTVRFTRPYDGPIEIVSVTQEAENEAQ